MLRRFFPVVDQLSRYNRNMLQGDLSAGLTVGVMLIPQGMAYALIAGLPPIYGLYASLVPLVIYALFGTSRQLAVGPVAMVSLLVAAGVAPLAGGDPTHYIGLALLLSLMVGVIQFGLGLARFGFLTNFLSHPVLAGFTSAAALIIGFSQLKHLMGIDLPRSNYVHTILWSAIQQLDVLHIPTLIIGATSIVLLVKLRRWKRAFPGALVVVMLSTVVVWLLDLPVAGVKIVGDVPRGLPAPVMPIITPGSLRALLPEALTIALVGFMESIAVAKVYASKNRYEVDANRELIGLGLANIIGAFFRAYPTTGGFSRTAVNAQAGAQTNLAAILSAGVIALTLLFLTPLFYYLPQAVLAAIVMVAVSGLIDWKEARFLWQVNRQDLGMMTLTFVSTLVLGIEEGILVGVAASLILVVHQASRPHTVIEGRLPGSNVYRNLDRNPNAERPVHTAVIRMDASLFFGNVAHFKERVLKTVDATPDVRTVVLDAYPINRMDASAAHSLDELLDELHLRKVDLFLAGVKGPLRDVLTRAGISERLGPNHYFVDVHEAVESVENRHAPQPTREELVVS